MKTDRFLQKTGIIGKYCKKMKIQNEIGRKNEKLEYAH